MWEKIVLNLLSNAFKFTFEGEISVGLRAHARHAELVVRDTGVGIPAVELPRVFECFHRVENQRGRSFEGTGIGLSLVQELVRLHGGSIRAESQVGRGSAFIVAIPFGTGHLSPGLMAATAVSATGVRARAYVDEALRWLPDTGGDGATPPFGDIDAALAAPPNAGRAKLLLADDNADMRDYIQQLLGARHEVVAVSDGVAALAAVRAERPDLVITDVMMPRLDGLGLARAIRADGDLSDLPIIMLSARAGEEASIEGRSAGADDYLVKPFSARELIARVDTALAMARLRRENGEALRALNATLEQRVADRTAERDEVWRNSQDLMVVVRFDLTIVAANPAWTRVLGWSEAELVGTLVTDWLHPDDIAASLQEAASLAAGRATQRFENRYRHKAGGWVWISWAGSPDGARIYATGRDVTEDKARQGELEMARQALRQAQKMEAIGQLTGGVAHDFNNLLTPIIGSLDLLRRRGVGGEREQRLIDGAIQSADRAKTLIQRLLSFARRQPLQAIAVDVTLLVRGMADLIGSTTGPQIKIVVDAGGDVTPALADPNQLEMALLNLAVNARDAMPEGGTLRISVGEDKVDQRHPAGLQPGRYVRLSVADTGTGMDEATLARAVEPFFSTKGVGKGTGLGLSSAHGLASQLGGGLTIQSRPGIGTNIEMWLPVSKLPAEAVGAVAEASPSVVGVGTALLVDDEELVRVSTSDMLVELGYRVVEAASAEAALRLVRGGLQPELLVTDHLMPGMSGTDLARLLRSEQPALRVLVVSGYAEGDGVAPDLARLTKPFRADELATSLAELQGKASLRPVKRRDVSMAPQSLASRS